jgi:AbrB family looped-hinge helix DNA binding protein
MQTIKKLAKSQIVIPADVRQCYGIKPGSRLEIRQTHICHYNPAFSKHEMEPLCSHSLR